MSITRWKGGMLVLATLAAAGVSWSAMLEYEPPQAMKEQHATLQAVAVGINLPDEAAGNRRRPLPPPR